MAKLKINAPDGKTLSIDIPEGTQPDQYDALVESVIADYSANQPSGESEGPGMLKSAALGAMSGIPGATAAVSGIQAIGDKTYEEAHKGLEEAKDQAWEENPGSYGAGKTAGMVGTAMAAPVSVPAALGVGALSGLDAATNLEDMPLDAAKGAGMGLALGKLGEKVVAPVISKAADLAKGAGKSVLAAMGGSTTKKNIEEYLQNPEAINNALSKTQIGEKIAGAAEDMGQASRQLSDRARGALDTEKAILQTPKPVEPNMMLGTAAPTSTGDETIRPVFDKLISRFTQSGVAPTAEKSAAVKVLNDEYERLAEIARQNNGNISERALREFIDSLQDTVNTKAWGDPGVAESQNALKQLSGELRSMLVKANPKYAQEMAPSAEAAGMSSDLADLFKLENGRPTDATFTKVGNVLKEGKTEGLAALKRLKEMTGMDIEEMLKKSDTKGAFDAAGSGSALKTLFASLGFGAGKMTGLPFGGIGGAAAGRFGAEGADGASTAKKILDAYINKSKAWQNSAVRPMLEKYGRVLADAAKVGGTQLAATHFVLGTSDSDYQQLESMMQDDTE